MDSPPTAPPPTTERSASSPKREHQRGTGVTSFLGFAAAAAAVASCMFNGHSAQAAAILALATGFGLLLAPPRYRLPRAVMLTVALVLCAASLSLLPASWWGSPPEWRTNLVENWGFILPDTFSPQPYLTQGALLTVAVACGWFILLAGQRPHLRSRRHTLRTVTLGILLIAGLGLADHFNWLNLAWPLGHTVSDLDMGPFPNRNHFSSLCAIGCVLGAALAHDSYLNRSLGWLAYAAATLIPFAAIVINTSRAGLVLFCLGTVAWLVTSAMHKGFFRKLAINASLMFCAAAVLMIFGGGAGARLAKQGIDTGIQGGGGRLRIYEETLTLAMQAPLQGIGLGNFDSIFALVHSLFTSGPIQRFMHPESDWLWWTVETGLPGLLAAICAAVWLLGANSSWQGSHGSSQRSRMDHRLRKAAGIGFGMALIHGLVDVPLHNTGFAFTILLLGACAVSPRKLKLEAGFLYRSTLRLLGLAIIGIGAAHLCTVMGRPLLPGELNLEHQRAVVDRLVDEGKKMEALEKLGDMINLAPLRWDLYYYRGSLRLDLNQPSTEALTDFGRARVLEPKNVNICLEEGKLWLKHDPALAIIPWREVLARKGPLSSYTEMLTLSSAHPLLYQNLRQLASTPSMKASYLYHVQGTSEWEAALADLLALDPNLEQIDLNQRRQIILAWQVNGNRDTLLVLLENHPDWYADSWPVLADEYAHRSNFEKAWELQKKYAYSINPQEVSSSLSIDQLERNFAFNPTDVRAGIELYFTQKRLARQSDAGRTLDRVLNLPSAPHFLRMEKAALQADQRDFRLAYETMKAALASKPK